MSEYQRFVSYLYEYRDNKKSKNCGFSRVEVRNHQCKLEIHMKLPACPFTPSFQVYAFVPSAEQLLGILLGKAAYHHGNVYASFTVPDREIGSLPCQISDLGGLMIRSDDGRIFATAWKEIPVQPDHFFLPETAPQIRAASLDETEKTISEESPVPDSPAENLPDNIPANNQTDALYQEKLSPDSHQSSPAMPGAEAGEVDILSVPDSTNLSPDTAAAQRWQKIRESYPHTQPFFDDEIHECVRLSLKDIPALTSCDLYIGSNQFLSHGCQTFHHFLLGKPENGRPEEYVLAVPGVYDEKERFLAAMFGFPNFKPARNRTIRPGQFGYWYRLIY